MRRLSNPDPARRRFHRARLFAARSVAVILIALPFGVQAAALGFDDARHLLNRVGFGAEPREINEYAKRDRAQAVDRLLANTAREARTPPPEWVRDPITPRRELREASQEERKRMLGGEIRRGLDLRTWWLQEMLDTRSALTERMTLFWHNHFVSSQQKVRFSKLVYNQNVLLRRHATGNFGELLHAVAKDPAMVIYLDSASNRKGKPNENFAREVMELFTLGEGHYSETDVREAARAFTGWSIEPETGEFKWRPFAHDGGAKTVLGRSGHFDGDAVLDILLDRPETSRFIVAKLWREFISPEPDPAEVNRIAAKFRASNYEIKTALRELLLSPAFWAPEARGALIKSPVDLVVGTLHTLDFEVGDPLPLALIVARLGQNLFSPPNVRGWPGGEAWINSSTLLGRKAFAERIFRDEDLPLSVAMAGRDGDADLAPKKSLGRMAGEGRERFLRALADIRFDPQRWLAQFPGAVTQDDIQRTLLARAPIEAIQPEPTARELIKRIALDPSYQLK
jgi:uncharacterized protein (DUF1800 family)